MTKAQAVAHVAQMAAIVATLLVIPAVGLLFGFFALVFQMPLHAFLTFGEALGEPFAYVAWWLLAFVSATIYAVLVSH